LSDAEGELRGEYRYLCAEISFDSFAAPGRFSMSGFDPR
jgi:hypothetical protein